jgi:2-keto-4-pentenoate hydratase
MTIDDAIRILWEAIQRGDHFPATLQGKLSLDDAYRVQLGILARRVEAGEQQSGWKVALSGAALRQARGLDEPVFGYLLASGHFISGQTLPYDDIFNPAIESELFITMGQRLRGPGVTRAQVLEAVAKVEPAFEVVSMRSNMTADMALGVADNIAQWGYVTGDPVMPYPKELVLAQVTANIRRNGQVEAQVRSADVLDDQLDSVAWLTNALARYDLALEAGHGVLTGSFTRPTPIAKGDQWTTQFSDVGAVTANFV